MKQHKQKKGFTLVELLIVAMLISILAGVVITVIQPGVLYSKARDGRRKGDLKIIQTALEQYFSANRSYPVSSWILVTGADTMSSALSPYLNSVPLDPVNDRSNAGPCGVDDEYGYNYKSDGSYYYVTAIMENAESAEDSLCVSLRNFNGGEGCAAGFGTNTVCYGVQNPF
jgi:prepilin-type N-terminal cleavage/methylation domain-containing protein